MEPGTYQIIKHIPDCSSHTSGSISIQVGADQDLSFSWLNLPSTANILDGGRNVYNLDCGKYFLEIYNLKTQETENLNVKLDCSQILKITMTQIENINCHDDIGQLNIAWSGGKAPYSLQINNKTFSITNGRTHSIEALPNMCYNITIKDKHGCLSHKTINSPTLTDIKIGCSWSSIKSHGQKCKDFSINISGGKPPYKTAIFCETDNYQKPIIVNQQSITDKLIAGNYLIRAEDSNNCIKTRKITLSQPDPMYCVLTHSGDYASQQPHHIEHGGKIHNLVLIHENEFDKYGIEKLDQISEVSIKYQNATYKNYKCMDYGVTKINKNKYYYFYIRPGINITNIKNTLELKFNNHTIALEPNTTFYNDNSKFICGSLIFSQDHSYAIIEKALLTLKSNDKYNENFEAKCSYYYVKNGIYLSQGVRTVINFISSDISQSSYPVSYTHLTLPTNREV